MEMVLIEWNCGIGHFAGREDIYVKYLERFLEDRHFEHAKVAFEKKDMECFKKEIHSLKGLAGTLGLMEIFWNALQVSSFEGEIDDSKIEEKMKVLEITYQLTCIEINEKIKEIQ